MNISKSRILSSVWPDFVSVPEFHQKWSWHNVTAVNHSAWDRIKAFLFALGLSGKLHKLSVLLLPQVLNVVSKRMDY